MLTTEECLEMNVGTGKFSDDVEMTAEQMCDTLSVCLSVCVYVCVCVLQNDIVSRLQPMVQFTLDSAGIADNLCKVEVYYEQFDYESIEESEAYPVITH